MEQETEVKSRWSFLPAAMRDCCSSFISFAESSSRCKGQGKDKEKNDNKDQVGKEIGLIYGGSLILNTIIGPGIFTSPKLVLSGAGSVAMSLLIWCLCGIFSTMAALCFAELRESVKREGVEYAYITEAFGPLAGFVYCWMRIAAAEPVCTAVFAMVLADYTTDSIYDVCVPPDMLRKILASLAVVSVALLNVFSQKLADRMQVLATVGKTAALSVIIYYGIKNLVEGKTDELDQGFNDTSTSPTSITFAIYNGLWAYGGWSSVNNVTSGLRKPPRNLPRLVKTIIPLVMILYSMVVTSYFTVMSRKDMLASQAIGVTWAERVFQSQAMAIIPIGVGLTALGSLNATFLSSGRLSGVGVKDGQMPEVVSWVHVRSKTPILPVYTRLIIAIIMIMVADTASLVRFFIFSVWLFHGMSILALLILRFKNKNKRRPYKVNLVLPLIVVPVVGFLIIGPFLETPKPEFISSLVLVALSLICYLPSHWISSKVSLPDKLIVWLQLFFRIAPKRELRRKSILRHMSMSLARNSIFIPTGASPATIRRIQGSPALMRQVSRASRLSKMDGPSSPTIRRNSILANMDVKRGRSASMWAWLETGRGGSPALIRRLPSRHAQSFGPADRRMPSLGSLPNLRMRYKHGMERESNADADTGTTRVDFSIGEHVESCPDAIATGSLPPGIVLNNKHLSAVTGMTNTKPKAPSIHHSSSTPHFPRNIPVLSSTIQEADSEEELRAEQGNSQLSRSSSEASLAVVGGFESEGGGEYEILALPQLAPEAYSTDDNSDSDSDNSSDDLEGIGSLFDSSTGNESDESSSSSLEEEGSISELDNFTDEEQDIHENGIILNNIDNRTVSYI